MGYCGFNWVSDYTYVGVLNYRASAALEVTAGAADALFGGSGARADGAPGDVRTTRALLVWGQIVDGRPVLEPTFVVDTRPALPSGSGANRIEGRARDGRPLFSFSFDGDVVPDVPGKDVRHFAFAIPLDAITERDLASLQLTGAAAVSTSIAASTATPGPDAGSVTLARSRSGDVTLRWSDPRARMALVRDRTTGEILAFARGGRASLRTRAAELDVQLSDGVRRATRRITVPTR
jgi:hypothetical protein